MQVIYHGPRETIEVAGYGMHKAGEVRDYPSDVALELVQNSVRQKFNLVPPVQPADDVRENTGGIGMRPYIPAPAIDTAQGKPAVETVAASPEAKPRKKKGAK